MMDDENVEVEFIYPQFYADACINTMSKFAGAIASYCRAAALLEQEYVEFSVPGMLVPQVLMIEEIFEKQYGVHLVHEIHRASSGQWITRFCADVSGLIQKM